jgi:penicillin-binding protein 2
LASSPTRERPRVRRRPATRHQPGSPPPLVDAYRPSAQVAFRLTLLAGILLAAFAVLFLRLWALQVLSSPQYLHAAQNNQLRTIHLGAPRGPILDREGRVVVGNTAGTSIQLWPADLPSGEEARLAVLRRLSEVVKVPVAWMLEEIERRGDDPLSPVTVKRGVHDDQVAYIYERQNQFPGVTVARTYVRSYPYKALAAHILGHVGEVSPEQLEQRADLSPGDEAGQGGIEGKFDEFLRGRPGSARLRVDSLGRARSGLLPTAEPQAGHALRLTLDVDLQQAAERALRHGIALARASDCIGCWSANGGAIVALDPRDGAILALASSPTYKPSVLAGRVDGKRLESAGLTPGSAAAMNFPALNRATAGLYPPGSVFKPITALAAYEEGLLQLGESLPCTPTWTRFQQEFRNWDPYVNEAMTLQTALARSCDTPFYEMGLRFWHLPPERGPALQTWAERFGFGRPTGLDIGGEDAGLLPTPAWRKRTFKTELDRSWKPGDSIQLAIGQKDLLVTPLQMARFYALIANGGNLVTPHVVADVEKPRQGAGDPEVLRRFDPPPPQPVGVDQQALAAVRDGLYLAAHASFGTSSGIFGNFPVEVAGKTGTAEKLVEGTLRDQSWWCGYAPADSPTIVVCSLIENGGLGGSAAAPASLRVFEAYFGRRAGPIEYRKSD